MELGDSDDRVYAAEKILKKRKKKVSLKIGKILNINKKQQQMKAWTTQKILMENFMIHVAGKNRVSGKMERLGATT